MARRIEEKGKKKKGDENGQIKRNSGRNESSTISSVKIPRIFDAVDYRQAFWNLNYRLT